MDVFGSIDVDKIRIIEAIIDVRVDENGARAAARGTPSESLGQGFNRIRFNARNRGGSFTIAA